MAFFPSADHIASLFYAHTLLSSHSLCILQREHVGQHFQEVSRATLTDSLFAPVGFLDVLAEEFHLAPEVVVQTPADEVLDALFPLLAICHIEHTSFQPGDDTGTVGEVPVGGIL